MAKSLRSSWRIFLSIAILLGIAASAQRWVQSGRVAAASATRPLYLPLSSLSSRIGSFASEREHEIPPDIMRVAQVDSFLHREYREDGSNRPIVLYVGYWGRPNVGLGHGPEVCYPANGWVAEGKPIEKSLVLTGRQGPETTARLALHHFTRIEPEGMQRVVVGFLAVVGGQFQPSSRGTFMHAPPQDSSAAFVAHIQAMTSVQGTSWSPADERVVAFLQHALPGIAEVLFHQPNAPLDASR